MTDVVNAVLSTLPQGGELWLECRDVAGTTPRDRPEFREYARSYRAARLYVVHPDSGDERWVGEWFSLPAANLRRHCGRHPELPATIRVDTLDASERDTLFEDANIVFCVGYMTTEEEWLWCEESDSGGAADRGDSGS